MKDYQMGYAASRKEAGRRDDRRILTIPVAAGESRFP
jgi:hypothetical protein